MFNNEVEKEVFWRVIGDLTFRPAVRIFELYESMAEQKPDRIRYDPLGKLTLDLEEKSSAYKRIHRLLPLFIPNEGTARSVESQLSMHRIYREVLFERQLHLYNWMAKRYAGQPIDTVLPIPLIKDAAYLDGAKPSLDEIVKYYPYYFEEDEKGIDFLEYMLLLNIAEVTQYRTQGLLKRLLENPKDKDRIKQWIASVKESLSSPKMYLAYVDTFFAVYRYIALEKYNSACVEASQNKDKGWEGNSDFLSYKLWQQADSAAENLEDIIEEVTLLAWRSVEKGYQEVDESLEDAPPIETTSKEMQVWAETYAEMVKTYIDQSIKEVERILPKLFSLKIKKGK